MNARAPRRSGAAATARRRVTCLNPDCPGARDGDGSVLAEGIVPVGALILARCPSCCWTTVVAVLPGGEATRCCGPARRRLDGGVPGSGHRPVPGRTAGPAAG